MGIPASHFAVLSIKLEEACRRGEFRPVTMVPFCNSMAALTKIPLSPFRASFWASAAASRAGMTTLLGSCENINAAVNASYADNQVDAIAGYSYKYSLPYKDGDGDRITRYRSYPLLSGGGPPRCHFLNKAVA